MKKYLNPEIEIITALKGADVITFSAEKEGLAEEWDWSQE